LNYNINWPITEFFMERDKFSGDNPMDLKRPSNVVYWLKKTKQ
jgi:hypothetical protein